MPIAPVTLKVNFKNSFNKFNPFNGKLFKTYANPLKNLKTEKVKKSGVTDEANPQTPSINKAAINTTFLPLVSAKHPHIYDPMTIPNIGAAVSHPFFSDVKLKSHVADGKTNDNIVIPTAVLA